MSTRTDDLPCTDHLDTRVTRRHHPAPPEQRAALVSAFYVAAYSGVSVPVVGVGLVAQDTNLLVASICLAAVIALLLLLTLAAVLWPVRRAAVKVGNR